MPAHNTVRIFIGEVRHRSYPGAMNLFVACTLLALLGCTRSYYISLRAGLTPGFASVLVDWLACFYPWVLLGPMAFFAEEKFSLERQHLIRNLSVLALTGSILAPLAIAIRMGLLFLATLFRMSGSVRESTGAGFFPELGAQLFLYALAIAGAFVTRTFVQKSERDRERDRLALEKSQLEASLRQAELETLRMRLNPHFLFNTLQNISVLAEHDPSSASQMLSRLGDLLRASFRSDFQAEVPLETELGLTQAYLDVESIRFGDRLSVSMDVSDRTRQALVPALLLQPLVENAIIHGLRAQNAGRIRIRSAIDGDRLMLTVSDNGVGANAELTEKSKVGVGLGSTRERLVRFYPGAHDLRMGRLDTGGTEVSISIPFRLRANSPEESHHEHPTLANC